MEKIYFNSRSELDAMPSGALRSGEKLHIGIRLLSCQSACDVQLVLKRDSGECKSFPLKKVWSENGCDRFECEITVSDTGLYWYYFSVDGRLAEKVKNGAAFCEKIQNPWQLTVYADDYTTPDWIKGGVFYHIFVDRFKKGTVRPHRNDAVIRSDWGGTPEWKPDENGEVRNRDFFGGNLDGVIEKLPYLAGLGVTCIYLSPIFEAASNHKYDTADYMKIDPSFGDEETYSALCAEAKKLGIRIILDGVFNHTGDDSVYFDKYSRYGGNGAFSKRDSAYSDWFGFSDWPEKYDCWWGIKTLPQLKQKNTECRKFFLGENGVVQKWMRLGASGWRLDVADELPDVFLDELRKRVKSEKSDALIIGEVWEDASNKTSYGKRRRYFQGSQLDSVMNYPLKDAIIEFVTSGNAGKIKEIVESLCENYPKQSLDCMMNILDSHDTPRILTVLGGKHYSTKAERAEARLSEQEYASASDKLFAATLLQFTLPGVPCVFYGDEAGVQGWEDPFCRACYPWGHEDDVILRWYKKLSSLRKNYSVLACGEYRTIRADSGVYIFKRESSSQCITVAVNCGCQDIQVPCPLGSDAILLANGEVFCNPWHGESKIILRPQGCTVISK